MRNAFQWTVFPISARRERRLKSLRKPDNKKGFSIVEVLSSCPTNWGMTPAEALDWLRDNMIPYYPLGVYKDITGGEK